LKTQLRKATKLLSTATGYILDKKTHIKDLVQGKTTTKSPRRAPSWRRVRAAHLKTNPACAACGESKRRYLEVHHIIAFHTTSKENPGVGKQNELNPNNLITLCDGGKNYGINSCHLFIGHNGNYRKTNSLVRYEARQLLERLRPGKC